MRSIKIIDTDTCITSHYSKRLYCPTFIGYELENRLKTP
jgi:hypothetical protein